MKEKVEFKGSVVLNPVPVVLITSKNKEGKENVFTVGWIGTVCTKPPMLSISIRPERLSYEYIKETMEFTVNLPSIDMTKAVDYCGVRPGRKFDKIKEMNFTMREGTNVDVSYIDECPISIECKVNSLNCKINIKEKSNVSKEEKFTKKDVKNKKSNKNKGKKNFSSKKSAKAVKKKANKAR